MVCEKNHVVLHHVNSVVLKQPWFITMQLKSLLQRLHFKRGDKNIFSKNELRNIQDVVIYNVICLIKKFIVSSSLSCKIEGFRNKRGLG